MDSETIKRYTKSEEFKKLNPEEQKEQLEFMRWIEAGAMHIDKKILRMVKIKPAIIYTALEERFNKLGKTKHYFSYTIKEMEERTDLSEFVQRSAIKKLIKAGLIDMKLAGKHRRRCFKLLY